MYRFSVRPESYHYERIINLSRQQYLPTSLDTWIFFKQCIREICLSLVNSDRKFFFTSDNDLLYLTTVKIMVDIPTFPSRKNICPPSESVWRKTVRFLFIHYKFCSLCNCHRVVFHICKFLLCKSVAICLIVITLNRKIHCGTQVWFHRESSFSIKAYTFIEFSGQTNSFVLRRRRRYFLRQPVENG